MDLKGKRILLTGVTGFLGQALAHRLLATGVETHVLLRPSSNYAPDTFGLSPNRIVIAPTQSAEIVEAVTTIRPDLIMHCAGRVLTDHQVHDIDDLITSNILLIVALMEGMAACGDGIRLVNVGTYLEYNSDGAFAPNSIYAASKKAALAFAYYYQNVVSTRIITLKAGIIYGPNDPRRRLLRILADAAADGRQIDLSPGLQQINLVHIEDAVDAMMSAGLQVLDGADTLNEEYFMLSGQSLTLRELVERIERLTGRHIDARWGATSYKATEVMCPYVDGPRLPGWSPQTDLDEGLRQILTLAASH